eukprot:CAMPEP_0196810484 /NCGR_PEP_ID=MMETSP1362-20130617/10297_1 /TAXON_ID=163516 /ORGANISM="Leptocylindrus danicus, Strain CCMP1856" /LENGTH=214 /DNA_ID=CAMNT_0042185497 /DNA_START=43 /DNA_END=687 /DNA_ORIENTATION=-
MTTPPIYQLTSQWINYASLIITFVLVWLENVKAFTVHQKEKISTYSMLPSKSATTTVRMIRNKSSKLFRTYSSASDMHANMGLKRVKSSSDNLNGGSMLGWSFPSMENMSGSFTNLNSALNNQKRVFGSWYHEIDPTARSPIYDDREVIGDYPLTSSSDSWLTTLSDFYVLNEEDNVGSPDKEVPRRLRPIRMVKNLANKAFGIGLGEVEKTSF